MQCLARQSTFQLNIRDTSVTKLLTPNLSNIKHYNRHSAQHSMSSWQTTFSTTFNIKLDNRNSAQHSIFSLTIEIQLNIQCLTRQSTFTPTYNVKLDKQHSQHSMSS